MVKKSIGKLCLALLGTTALTACGDGWKSGSASDDEAVAAESHAVEEQASTPDADVVAAETDRLNAWFAEKWEEGLEFSPITKTTLGIKEDYDKINDFSEAGQEQQLQWGREAVAEMRAEFDYDLLTPEAKTSYDLYVHQLNQSEANWPFRDHGYTFSQLGGAHTFLPTFLINFHRVDTAEDMEAYISRLNAAARALGQALEGAQKSARMGIRPPRFAYEGAIGQSRSVISGAPFTDQGEAPLWADAKSKINALLEQGAIDEDQAETLRSETREALTTAFQSSYEAVIDWLEEDMSNADEIATGVGSLPQGDAYYRERLANYTTTDMTAEEVHQLGLDEVARIHGEMELIKDAVGFEGSLQDFFTFVREDSQFYYPDTDEGREEYLQAARDHLDFIKQRLPEYFGILPKADLVVRRVEAFRERPGGAQFYSQATPDGSRPGVFYAHLSDMNAMPIPQLEVIAYHEGNPGHHMQISIAQELTDIPTFRTQPTVTAYIEGWALYAEYLAKEMGAYDDPYSDFGRLSSELWRAIRLVVDTGLHAKGWTEEEAVTYFQENSAAPEGQIRSEVQRYIVAPGQATAYKIGMLKILELRSNARNELGEKFDIRGFHDTVLGGGALPLSILERRVDEWIAAEKAS
ncbi:DUF885 domain-containing protein [Hyphococcus flavus]|uniref:DUF885 domain-containing protein n=1 Tax=Hyphococcus flavus TaxID=1866326 RepID=A0AAE9ZAQ1_9PROT|nr:DUF885 domain-containing protein [Hyphococcus flavus]WDI30316.1 DUF885 domain-containing protein [Hyphococcus flavus]